MYVCMYVCMYDSLSLYRLLGLTPVIQTICNKPTELLLWDDTPVTYFINPWALIGMFWILGSDFQLWLSTKVIRGMIVIFESVY